VFIHLMKGTTMTTRTVFGFVTMVLLLASTAVAGGKGELQRYLNNAANKVKATDDPSEKRKILNESFQRVSMALDMVQSSTSLSKEDAGGIELLKATLQEKQQELAGDNGYTRVSDTQLNDFSEYVVEDLEQADQMVTISVVTLLLIIILVFLLAR
jgi:hypothetical protein